MRMLAVSDGNGGGKIKVAGWREGQQRMEPEPRMEKVARVQAAIASGKYHVSAKELADRLLERWGVAGRMKGGLRRQ
jgi:hypothetical protein